MVVEAEEGVGEDARGVRAGSTGPSSSTTV